MKIEKFIHDNKNCFSTETTPAGHTERFEKLLRGSLLSQRRKRVMNYMISIAASLVILMTVSLFFFNQESKEPSQLEIVQQYYDSKLNEEIAQLDPLLKQLDSKTQIMLIEKINEIKNESILPESMSQIPEDQQLAYSMQIYNCQSKSIQRIMSAINK